MCSPGHEVTVIFATFKTCYDHFHSAKLIYFAYLTNILWYDSSRGTTGVQTVRRTGPIQAPNY